MKKLLPPPVTLDVAERWRIAVGAFLGLLLAGLVSQAVSYTAPASAGLVAPLGASALLLFAVANSPMAQPWPTLLGNVVSAVVGVACARWIPHTLLAGAAAVALAILAMLATRALHPPGGAVALFAVLGHHVDFAFAMYPVALCTLVLVLGAVAYHRLTGRRYPQPLVSAAPAAPAAGHGFAKADIDAVLASYNQVLDVSRSDLEDLLGRAQAHAYARRLGETLCSDVMSRDVVSVQFGDSLVDAWALMRDRRIKALPVVDKVRRIVGIITTGDFMRHAGLDAHDGLGQRLRDFVRPSGQASSSKPEAVGQIMTRKVRVASAGRPLADLLPLFSEHGHHHIPIVDDEQRLVGILTQTDVVRALSQADAPGTTT